MTKRAQPEFGLHKFTVQLLMLNAAPGVLYYHPPNGEYRSKRTAGRLKLMGVRAGVADIALVLPPLGMSAFLELKIKPNKLTDEQAAFQRACLACGALFAVAYTPEEVKATLEAWGAIRSTSAKPKSLPIEREAKAA